MRRTHHVAHLLGRIFSEPLPEPEIPDLGPDDVVYDVRVPDDEGRLVCVESYVFDREGRMRIVRHVADAASPAG